MPPVEVYLWRNNDAADEATTQPDVQQWDLIK
jgi:hypothetical protein